MSRSSTHKDVQFFINNPYLLVLNSSHPYVNVLTPYCEVPSVAHSHKKITEEYQGEYAKTVVYIKLWRNRPSSKDAPEDFAYIIKMEP